MNKYQWIFSKLGICIDIVKIWFWFANGQISSVFDRVICLLHDTSGVLSFHILFLSPFLYGRLHKMIEILLTVPLNFKQTF